MAILSQEFYNDLAADHANRVKQAAAPVAPPTPTPAAPQPAVQTAPLLRQEGGAFRFGQDISKQEQVQKYGGEVGSSQYYQDLGNREVSALAGRVGTPVAIGTALGAFGGPPGMLLGAGIGAAAAGAMPDQEEWDKMGTSEKALSVTSNLIQAPVKLVLGLPAAMAKAIPNLIETATRPIIEGANPFSKEGLDKLASAEQNKPWDIPVVGTVDPFYSTMKKNAEDFKSLGYSDGVSSVYSYLQGGVEILNNALVGDMFAKGLKSFVKTPGKLVPGEAIADTAPIQQSMDAAKAGLDKQAGKLKEGSPSIYHSVPKDFQSEVAQSTGSNGRVSFKITPAGEGKVEVALVQSKGPLQLLKDRFGPADSSVAGKFGKETKIESHIVNVAQKADDAARVQIQPISEVIKGTENRPITNGQLDNLSAIGRSNGVDPAIQDTLVKTLTGKSVVGELTNAEYVKVAKTLSTMNKLNEFATGGEASLFTKYVGKTISPPRSWMEAVERKTGVPIYNSWLDIENGARLSKISQEALQSEARNLFGKYADNSNASIEMRRLVDAHMHGDTAAITKNPALTPEVRSDLLGIVDGVQKFYETHGEGLNVPKEIYRTNEAGYYAPDVADLGGISQKYKGAEFPGGKTFFAKEKKQGGAYVRVDDPLQLMDIYARQGSQAKFMDEAIGRAKELHDTAVPEEFKGSFKSAVQEKLGYEDGMTRFLDDMSGRVNNALGRDLPPDLGRRITQGVFSYMYTNALNSPATWLRNEITNNMMLHARLGTEFWGKAKMQALSKEGMAEVRSKGFLNDSNIPYGADLGTVQTGMKNVAEKILAPQGAADNLGRATAYFQAKNIFEDTLSKYNSGKLTFQQAEAKMGLDTMSPIEANRVRKNLIAGNTEGAFQEYARSVIDETNFPYRRGSSARVTYGTGGKVGTFLYKWNIEAAHTMGRWVRDAATKAKSGDMQGALRSASSVVRYYTAAAAMVKSFKDAYGLDFSGTIGGGPINASYPTSVKFVMDVVNSIQAQTGDNAQAIDDAKDELVKSLKTFAFPGGVDAKNLQDFYAAYSAGPDKDGNYQPRRPDGSTAGNPVPFHDIWARLFGLPTQSKVDFQQGKTESNNYLYERSQAIQKVAELRNAGKDDEADDIVLQWESRGENIEPGRQSYDRFDVPEGERIYKRLPAVGKELFGDKILK